MITLTITAVNSTKGVRYYVDNGEGRLHILNEKSLRWNLKRIFCLSPDMIKQVMEQTAMYQGGSIKVTFNDEVAA
jgi:hypothetical protein